MATSVSILLVVYTQKEEKGGRRGARGGIERKARGTSKMSEQKRGKEKGGKERRKGGREGETEGRRGGKPLFIVTFSCVFC